MKHRVARRLHVATSWRSLQARIPGCLSRARNPVIFFHVSDLTVMLEQIERGDAQAASRLLPLVYDELRKLAAQKMARENPGQTLQATALVHEAWLRLGGDQQAAWQNRAHFFAAAAEPMRRILMENARRKKRMKHGGHLDRVNANDKWTSLRLCRTTISWRWTKRSNRLGRS